MSEESNQPIETNPDDDQEDLEIEEDLALEEDLEIEEDLALDEEEFDEMEDLKSQLAKKEEEIKGLIDKQHRSQAEMENFRKRIRKEKADSIKYANEQLLKKIIPISENLDRALSAPNISVESIKEGVEMIAREFHNFLKEVDVKVIPALGEIFDPSIHEALSQIESDEHEENIIMEEYSKGYYLNGRVIISAKVVIAKKPSVDHTDDSLDDEPEIIPEEPTHDTETAS